MKETKLKQDEYKNIDIRSIPVNSFINVKLLPNSSVSEKTLKRKVDGVEFVIYSIKVLHNGEETWMKLTPSVAKTLRNTAHGKVVSIFALPSTLKGGKAYSVSSEDEDPVDEATDLFADPLVLTQEDMNGFNAIIEQLEKKGLSTDTVDEAMIIKALSGRLGFTLERAEQIAPMFNNYSKDTKALSGE